MPRHWPCLLVVMAAVFFLIGAEESSRPEGPRRGLARAAPAPNSIKVDGLLTEKEWGSVPAEDRVNGLRRRGGRPSSLSTECMLLHDAKNLYVAAKCRERGMTGVGAVASSEADVLLGDHIAFCFDREADGRSFLVFAVGPAGVGADLYAVAAPDEGATRDLSYGSGWSVAVQRGEDGWNVEAAIPLSALGLAPAVSGAEIGFEVVRVSRDVRETSRWAGDAGDVLGPRSFGRLAVGDAPVAVTFQGIEQDAGRDPCAVFEARNPGRRDQTVAVSVRLKSASRSSLTSRDVALEPLETQTVRLPLLFLDPTISLELRASRGPRLPAYHQEIEFTVEGLKVWLPVAVCREGRSGLPLRFAGAAASAGQPTRLSAEIVEKSTGQRAALSRHGLAGPSGELLLDVRGLRPGSYQIRCRLDGGPAAAAHAACSLLIVPQTVRLGSEWSWEPTAQLSLPGPGGTTP